MYAVTKIAGHNTRIKGQKLYLANTVRPMWTLRPQDARPFKSRKEAAKHIAQNFTVTSAEVEKF